MDHDRRTSLTQFARAIASDSRIIDSSCRTVILKLAREPPSSCRSERYFSTSTAEASVVS